MMRTPLALMMSAVAATGAAAQSSSLPPVRHLPPPIATSERVFRFVSNIRSLPNGTLFVNDGRSAPHRLLLVDTTLKLIRVASDSLPAISLPNGSWPSGVMAYLGDSTLVVELATPEIYVIDNAGRLGRTMALPNPGDARWLGLSIVENRALTDARGRLLYRGANPRPASEPQPKPGEQIPFSYPDSAPVLRADLTTRKIETIAWFKLSKRSGTQVGRPDGGSISYVATNPTAATDDFAVLSDGAVAILRADYHVDLVGADGVLHSSPRMPYPWERLTDTDKAALMDSVRKASDARLASQVSTASGGGGGASGAFGPMGPPPPDLVWAKPNQLADYRRAFTLGALHADAHGNLWIRTEQRPMTPNTAIYDVVNREGRLIDRIEIALDRAIVGFDATSVYLTGRDNGTAWLERVRIP
jgi:hypothetical protein